MMHLCSNGILVKNLGAHNLIQMKELKDETWLDTHHVTIVNIEDQLEWFNKLQYDNTKLYLVAAYKIEGYYKDVGTIKIDNIDTINGSCNIGRDVFAEYRDRIGYPLYGFSLLLPQASIEIAFDYLNLRRIEFEILETNKLAIKCAKMIGMTQDFIKRKACYKNGKWIDSLCFSIIRDAK